MVSLANDKAIALRARLPDPVKKMKVERQGNNKHEIATATNYHLPSQLNYN